MLAEQETFRKCYLHMTDNEREESRDNTFKGSPTGQYQEVLAKFQVKDSVTVSDQNH